uniref:Uncharacterized protein n=1 Tax=Hyaloperonospora arabidopsidis (strain Emoy2) TaxID=559515 RepID=M4BWP0_HYAAE
MTGAISGVITRLQQASLGGFYCVWCRLHQLCNGAPEQHTGQPVWSYYHRQQREWCLATSVDSAEEGKATRN